MSGDLDGFRRYVKHRVQLAAALNSGQCGGDYSDGCVILASVVSGISADLWPGKGIDRARFIETWVGYADSALMPKRISVPLLVRRLKRKGDTSTATTIETAFPESFGGGNTSRVLTAEVDRDEAAIQGIASGLELKIIRDRAYPAVFYEHVRSTLVHESHLDNRASAVPMTDKRTGISYVNVLDSKTMRSQRRIHFHFPWLVELVRSVAANVEKDLVSRPLPQPPTWWIHG
jgi:hypothetical protein